MRYALDNERAFDGCGFSSDDLVYAAAGRCIRASFDGGESLGTTDRAMQTLPDEVGPLFMFCHSLAELFSSLDLVFYRNDSSTSVSSISRTTLSSIQLLQLNMAPIGFVGLGIMGEGMAARLLSQGVAGMDDETPLVIWNRTGSKCTALVEKFPDKKIIIKSTAREVVETCGVTYSMLSTPEASKIVFEGDDGVLAGVAAGKSIVDCATLAEADMQRMNQQVTEKGG